MKRILVATLLLAVAGAAAALTTGGSAAYLDQRIAELDGALLQLRVELADGRVPEAQKPDVLALQRSLEAERALLVERKAVLARVDPQGGAASPAPSPAPAPAPAPAPIVTPPGQSTAASTMPLSAPKPRIPDAVCQQRLSGWVGLEFAILPDGKVADVRVTGSEPAGAFDAAAAEAVAARTYASRPLPMKMREKMFMSFSDCRAEQLRASAPIETDACVTVAVEARAVAAPFAPEESGRAVLAGPGAQVYSAPSMQCELAGKRLRPGTRLEARMEFKEYSLVTTKGGTDEMWVRSNQLKDTAP
jgi:TonB family protein